MTRLDRILFVVSTAIAAIVTAACVGLLISMLTGCAARPRTVSVTPVAVPWCVWALARNVDGELVHVLVCTEDRKSCEDGRATARTPLGTFAGIRAVGYCQEGP